MSRVSDSPQGALARFRANRKSTIGNRPFAAIAVALLISCGPVLAEDPTPQRPTTHPAGPLPDEIPVDTEREAAFAESAGKTIGHAFAIHRTDHFIIAHDAGDDPTVRDLGRRLEATYRAVRDFCRFNDIPIQPPLTRMEVYFFSKYTDLDTYARSLGTSAGSWSGFYYSGNNRAAFYNALDEPKMRDIVERVERQERVVERLSGSGRRSASRDEIVAAKAELARLKRERDDQAEHLNRLVVQHEAAHQILYNFGVHVIGSQNPNWLTEGLACLFETPPSDFGSGAATVNQLRLGDFRSACLPNDPQGRMTPKLVERAINDGHFAPLRELIGEPRILLERANKNLIYQYAQSWSLVYYLVRARRTEFADYVRSIARREIGREYTAEEELADFERAFGPIDDLLRTRWANYIIGIHFNPNAIR